MKKDSDFGRLTPFLRHKMELIRNLWDSFFSSKYEKTRGQVAASPVQKAIPQDTTDGKKLTEKPWTLEDDVQALERRFGDITGRTLEISLSEILSICERKRKKSDAFKGLISYLRKHYNTTLTIKPKNHD